jgi:hypothetical protein
MRISACEENWRLIPCGYKSYAFSLLHIVLYIGSSQMLRIDKLLELLVGVFSTYGFLF